MYHTFQTIIIPGIIVFAVTLFGTKFLMSYFYRAGIVAEDKNKEKPVILPSSGGLAVAFGIVMGLLVYVFGGNFVFSPVIDPSDMLAVALSIVLIAMVGFLDDLNVKQKKVKSTDMMDIREGLKQWQKPVLTIIGALPLIAINAGVGYVNIPFFGSVDLGLFYPLLILPLAIIFVSNSVNLLGGFDGLQPGMALIASFGLLIYSLLYGTYAGTLLSTILFAAILAFIPFNMYRAKVIPGDSFTYTVGASLVAIMAIGNAEAFGTILFIPWIIEFILHLRRKFHVTDLGIRERDGTFKAPYGKKIYSLTHLVMNYKKLREREVTLYICLIEAAFVILAFLLKAAGLL